MYDKNPQLTFGLYGRISDDREGQRLGVGRQEKDSTQLATQLSGSIHRFYCDNDVSVGPTSTKPRPDYVEMLQDARNGKINAVIAYSTSRLTRRPREVEDLIDLAVEHGIRFYFVVSPPWDLNTADGRERARQDSARDRGEVERLQERILRKKLADAESGRYPGGRRTYAIGKLVGVIPGTSKEVRDWTQLDDEEAAVLRLIRDRILAGDSQMTIVRSLNRDGITTSLGYPWTVGKLKRTLLNESYVIFDPTDPEKRGTRLHKAAKHRSEWPGIFTEVEHQTLVQYFQLNPNSWQQGKVIARNYLLSGLAQCGNCGGVMYGQGKTENDKYIRRYHCKKYNNRGEQVGCCKVFRIADPVDELVCEAVLFRFDSPAVAEALAPTQNKERVRELTEEIVRLQTRRQQLAAEHAINPYEDYGVMVATIKRKSESAQYELDKLRSEEAKRAMVPALGSIRPMFENASLEWKLSVIKLVVDKVIVHKHVPTKERWNGRQFNPDCVEIIWRE